jgi:hypothetical protein
MDALWSHKALCTKGGHNLFVEAMVMSARVKVGVGMRVFTGHQMAQLAIMGYQ